MPNIVNKKDYHDKPPFTFDDVLSKTCDVLRTPTPRIHAWKHWWNLYAYKRLERPSLHLPQGTTENLLGIARGFGERPRDDIEDYDYAPAMMDFADAIDEAIDYLERRVGAELLESMRRCSHFNALYRNCLDFIEENRRSDAAIQTVLEAIRERTKDDYDSFNKDGDLSQFIDDLQNDVYST